MKTRHLAIVSCGLAAILAARLLGGPAYAAPAGVRRLGESAAGPSLGASDGRAPGGAEARLDPVDDTAVVMDYDALAAALGEDNGITTVYLGADIAAGNTGITIHPAKKDVIIDGRPPETPEDHRAAFVQYNANGLGYTLQAGAAAIGSVTLRNLVVTGYNHYGVVGVAASVPDITVRWENVAYSGPQASYNPSGTEHYKDSTFAITQGRTGPEELAELAGAVFEGRVTVESHSTANALLWTYKKNAVLRLLEGAAVSATVTNDFLYTGGNTPDLILEPGSSLTVVEENGFTRGTQNMGDVRIDQGASLTIRQGKGLADGTLRLERTFEMRPDSSLRITRGPGAIGSALGFAVAGGRAVFDHPRHVALYTPSAKAIRFLDRGSISIATDSLNLWTRTGSPDGDDFAAMPDHFWNRAQGALTVEAGYASATLTALSSNLAGEDPVDEPLYAETFRLLDTQLLTMGRIALEPDTPRPGTAILTGVADPAAYLSAEVPLESGSAAVTGRADAAGSYRLHTDPVAGGTIRTTAGRDFLRMRKDVSVDREPGRLAFTALPASLAFRETVLSAAVQTVGRLNGDWRIAVADTRPAKSAWRLEAFLETPLEALVNGQPRTLPQGLVFVDSHSAATPLGPEPLPVYEYSGPATEIDIAWGEARGLLLRVPPGTAYSDAAYSARIHWLLTDAP